MNIVFPCPTCGQQMAQDDVGEFLCWHGCVGRYSLDDLLRGLLEVDG